MSLTTYMAIYGAILSSAILGWNIYTTLRDRPKIKVSTSFGFFTFFDKTGETALFIKAINRGRRSVHLSSFGLRTEKEDLMIVHRITGLPRELKEGKSHSEWFTIKELRKPISKNKIPDFAWFKDETGKMYKSKPIKQKIKNYFDSMKNKKGLNKNL